MDATWTELPKDPMLNALERYAPRFNSQETSNCIYGLAIMDCPWISLPLSTMEALRMAVVRLGEELTLQEVSNIMYSLSVSTFDAYADFRPFLHKSGTDAGIRTRAIEVGVADDASSVIGKGGKGSKRKKRTADEVDGAGEVTAGVGDAKGISTGDVDVVASILYDIHTTLLQGFKRVQFDPYDSQSYDQFASYFYMLSACPGGREMIAAVLGNIPLRHGPGGSIPSRMHAVVSTDLLQTLLATSDRFSITHEFCGLNGVFDIDSAVYIDDDLIVFIEVDGEFHYRQGTVSRGELVLRRKDRLKEHLYRSKFPDIPLLRLRSDQIDQLGSPRSGQILANWVLKLPSVIARLSPPS
jgi:hypothetical protein